MTQQCFLHCSSSYTGSQQFCDYFGAVCLLVCMETSACLPPTHRNDLQTTKNTINIWKTTCKINSDVITLTSILQFASHTEGVFKKYAVNFSLLFLSWEESFEVTGKPICASSCVGFFEDVTQVAACTRTEQKWSKYWSLWTRQHCYLQNAKSQLLCKTFRRRRKIQHR